MPLVFIHGVNNRNTDADYARSAAARRTLFEQYLVPAVVKKGFPQFKVADDIYWGDLGVTFGWNLRCVPDTSVIQSLGPPGQDRNNLDLLQVVMDSTPSSEAIGIALPLVAAARRDPAALVRAVFAPDSDLFSPLEAPAPGRGISATDKESAGIQGENLGLILMAVDQFAEEVRATPQLIQASTDAEVLQKINEGMKAKYKVLAQPRLDAAAAATKEHLGGIGTGVSWALDHISGMVAGAGKAIQGVVAGAQRGTSLLVLKQFRDGVSHRALRFLGDVFVYLHHGRTAKPAIYDRVKSGLLSLQMPTNSQGEREPLIVVTHSFGSEVLYDLLTSEALSELPIDLWVTAGAQTSLFAEMQLFAQMKPLPADMSGFVLGRPATVKKWINFYDAADVLSYLHEPVFGKAAVCDIPVRAHANLTNAHGHYFLDPAFYQRIAQEV